MSDAHPRHRTTGFTLLEVLVALVIVALGMSALLETLTQSARNVAALRDRTVAEWIAMNQLALARLSLNAPSLGTTQGDVQNCANGDWHWQQQVSAVSAIPGLLSITVSVRRTGNASNTSGPPGTNGSTAAGSSAGGNSGLTHPGTTSQLGPSISLAPTAPLGSVTSVSTAGCASVVAPGSSLGSPGSLGAPAPGSLGAPSTLGGSPQPGGPSLGATSAATTGGPAVGPFGLLGSGAGGSGSSVGGSSDSGSDSNSSGSDSSKSSSNAPQWLVTLTGFRGNSLAAAVGESPDWGAPYTFPGGNAATNGVPNGTPGTTTPSNSSGGISSTPVLLHAPSP